MRPSLDVTWDAFVADAPVNAAVLSDRKAVHVMAGVRDMNPESVGKDFSDIGNPVFVGIAQWIDLLTESRQILPVHGSILAEVRHT